MIFRKLIAKSLTTTLSLSSSSSSPLLLYGSSSNRLCNKGLKMMATTTGTGGSGGGFGKSRPRGKTEKTLVLDPTRDPFATATTSRSSTTTNVPKEEDEAYKALYDQLTSNHKLYSIKYGPTMAFHNHAAAMMTSIYRLGGSKLDKESIYGPVTKF